MGAASLSADPAEGNLHSATPSKATRIYDDAEHCGAVVRALQAHGHHNLVTRAHDDLDLLDQAATRVSSATAASGYAPSVDLEIGLAEYLSWLDQDRNGLTKRGEIS